MTNMSSLFTPLLTIATGSWLQRFDPMITCSVSKLTLPWHQLTMRTYLNVWTTSHCQQAQQATRRISGLSLYCVCPPDCRCHAGTPQGKRPHACMKSWETTPVYPCITPTIGSIRALQTAGGVAILILSNHVVALSRRCDSIILKSDYDESDYDAMMTRCCRVKHTCFGGISDTRHSQRWNEVVAEWHLL